VNEALRLRLGDDGDERAACESFLRRIGESPDRPLPIAEAALALAALDRPRVPLARYLHHLTLLARDTADLARRGAGLGGRIEALNDVILGKFGYEGDTLNYDDLQNANLMRVIDRRRGLPVALGILFIHTARAQGWDVAGLAFPGHFLIRLELDGERAILDPFNAGRVLDAAALRELLKTTAGNQAELDPHHYAPVSDREVLLRLQNNIKLRQIQMQQPEKALAVVETMLLFAPGQALLWREAGLINAHLDNLRAAVDQLERFMALETADALRHKTALLLQQLKARLN
jgi:regulator of sirC expression with transglutaminase-like and TPR domain